MGKSGPNLLVVGSINVDLTVHVDSLPQAGESRIGSRFVATPGGKGANQAVAAARLGGRVKLVGMVGGDGYGAQALERLRAEGVDVGQVRRDDALTTGTAFVLIESSGQNRIVSVPGANYGYRPEWLTPLKGLFEEADMVVCQLEMGIATALRTAELAAACGKPLLLNPGPAAPVPDALLRLAAYVTPNETEAQAITGVPVADMEQAALAADAMLARGAANVVVTLGALGSYAAARGGRRLEIAAYDVRAVDTVAAGDTYTGALAVELCKGASLEAAAAFASAAAAVAVTREGAMASIPSRADVEAFIQMKQGEKSR